jgi:hypothetical protein
MTATPHYCRIYLKGGPRAFILRVEREDARVLIGIEVNADGDEIVPAGHDERRHIIEKAAIMLRICQVWDRKYGKLFAASKQTSHRAVETAP